MIAWAKVLRIFYQQLEALQTETSPVCETKLGPDLRLALIVSFLEFFNAMSGITRSKPQQVLLFALVRASVEMLVAPLLPSCSDWQHLLTVFVWSLGDTIRFGCFLLDALVPGARLAKTIRYTVGPILFPIGATGEALMVAALAQYRNWPLLYGAAALWPVGFFPLMKQLLRQRRKFFYGDDATKKAAKVKAV